jgi:hypothetical protein
MNKKFSVYIVLLIIVLIAKPSFEQFSYSANWGKRSSNNQNELKLKNTRDLNLARSYYLKLLPYLDEVGLTKFLIFK